LNSAVAANATGTAISASTPTEKVELIAAPTCLGVVEVAMSFLCASSKASEEERYLGHRVVEEAAALLLLAAEEVLIAVESIAIRDRSSASRAEEMRWAVERCEGSTGSIIAVTDDTVSSRDIPSLPYRDVPVCCVDRVLAGRDALRDESPPPPVVDC
jgi:hypothetical protein